MSAIGDLLELTPDGLYCGPGRFHIDPWNPVKHAVVTHGHADHARPGSCQYLAAQPSQEILRSRLGASANLDLLDWGESRLIGDVSVTLYPAGHILGSAQILIEKKGYRVVVTGDFKRQADPTCRGFEPVRCHTLVTESTFGLPIYRWPDSQRVMDQVNQWWRSNQEQGKASLLLGYSLGKAQRLLAGLDPAIGPILTHGAVEKINQAYRASGVDLPMTQYVGEADSKSFDWSQALIIAPPAVAGTTWTRRFGRLSLAMASGWMHVRGNRRRQALDRGFVLSDHADWPGLLETIEETECEEVYVTHGFSDVLVRHLRERGWTAHVLETRFRGESEEGDSDLDATDSDPVPEANSREDMIADE